MTVRVTGKSLGGKKIELTHAESGYSLTTDAPKDNNGDGSSFSPTDLVGASLGSCMLTIIAIYGEKNGIDVEPMSFVVDKTMSSTPPRRIAQLDLDISLPARLSPEQRERLERAAKSCPVHHSLHPDTKLNLNFIYQ